MQPSYADSSELFSQYSFNSELPWLDHPCNTNCNTWKCFGPFLVHERISLALTGRLLEVFSQQHQLHDIFILADPTYNPSLLRVQHLNDSKWYCILIHGEKLEPMFYPCRSSRNSMILLQQTYQWLVICDEFKRVPKQVWVKISVVSISVWLWIVCSKHTQWVALIHLASCVSGMHQCHRQMHCMPITMEVLHQNKPTTWKKLANSWAN